MRLFTALWLPDEVRGHLDAAVAGVSSRQAAGVAAATEQLKGFRFVPPERWHLTLCFHGDDADQEWLADRLSRRMLRLRRRNPGFRAPRLRLAAAGTFRGVLWTGVEPAGAADAEALRALVRVAGADPRSFKGHLTIARWSAGRPDRAALSGLFADYSGPWWEADGLALVRSSRGARGPEYETVHHVALGP